MTTRTIRHRSMTSIYKNSRTPCRGLLVLPVTELCSSFHSNPQSPSSTFFLTTPTKRLQEPLRNADSNSGGTIGTRSYVNRHSSFSEPVHKKTLISGNEDVHCIMKLSKSYRDKPIFRRQGDVRLKTGKEAVQMLIQGALRHYTFSF